MPPAFPRPATRSSTISSRSMSLISIRAAIAAAIRGTRGRGGRIVAIGTTVARALEAGAPDGTVRAGNGVVTGGIGTGTKLRIVDALLTSSHEPGTSHHACWVSFSTRRCCAASMPSSRQVITELMISAIPCLSNAVSLSRRLADRPSRAHGCLAHFVLHGTESTHAWTLATYRDTKGANALRHQNTVFHTLLKHLPWGEFERLAEEYGADQDERGSRKPSLWR
jgi:Queuosine biosynthesis protein